MAWAICIAVMAAFGALSMLWAFFGWMLPGSGEGLMLCRGTPGLPESGFIRRYLFLRDLGLIGSPLIIVDQGLADAERHWLQNRRCGIELLSPAEFAEWLELERNQIDGTGNGDHSGRDQRRGLSEL